MPSVENMTRQSVKTSEEHLRSVDPVLRAIIDRVRARRAVPTDGAARSDRSPPTRTCRPTATACSCARSSARTSPPAHRASIYRETDGSLRRPPADTAGDPRRRSRRAVPGRRPLEGEDGVPALAGRAHRLRRPRPRAAARAARRGRDRTARHGEGHRHLDRRHVPDVPPEPAGRAAGRRPRPPPRRREGVRAAGPPGPAELERIAEPWRPYRTLACLYLWRTTRATPQV